MQGFLTFVSIQGKASLNDSGLSYDKIKSVVASYCYGDPTCGQRAVYELGLTGVPVYNVNNNCSSGSTALMMARRLVQSGVEDCVMALGILRELTILQTSRVSIDSLS